MTKERFFEIVAETAPELVFDSKGIWDARPEPFNLSEDPDLDEENVREALRITLANNADAIAALNKLRALKKELATALEGPCPSNTVQQ